MPDGAAADVGLADLVHLDGAHDAAIHAVALEAVLEREGVDHRREHAHVVALRAVHAGCRALDAAEDVAAAHDDGHLDAVLPHGLDLVGEPLRHLGVNAEVLVTHEGLAGELQKNALVLVGRQAILHSSGRHDRYASQP